MYIKSVTLDNFRNYKDLNLELDPFVNIIYGDNAQGKTNILESIFIGATTKSHKQSKDKDIIKFGEDEAHIRIELIKNDISYRIDMHLRKNKTKVISINGVPLKKAAQLMGILNTVFFSPEDLSIIKNGPSERRRFLDMELCQLDPYYLHNLSIYNKTVNQRNKLLKDKRIDNDKDAVLDIYDEQLVRCGTEIIDRRDKFINDLNEIIRNIHFKLTGNKEECKIVYAPDVKISDYKTRLSAGRNNDIKLKTTTTGPHRDDIIFLINDEDVRKFGSQGQQRTSALSLKLSEIEIIKKITKDYPVLLLDDVLSELDSNRQNYLLESINDIQTIITCTGMDEFVNRRFNINKVYHVVEGKILKDSSSICSLE